MVFTGPSSTCERTLASRGCTHETQDPLCKLKLAKIKAFVKKIEFKNSFYFCKLLCNHECVSELIFEWNWYDTQNECMRFYKLKIRTDLNESAFMYFKWPVYFTFNLLISMLSAFINFNITALKEKKFGGAFETRVHFFLFAKNDISVLLTCYSFPHGFPF